MHYAQNRREHSSSHRKVSLFKHSVQASSFGMLANETIPKWVSKNSAQVLALNLHNAVRFCGLLFQKKGKLLKKCSKHFPQETKTNALLLVLLASTIFSEVLQS